jgi:hypothetical protein
MFYIVQYNCYCIIKLLEMYKIYKNMKNLKYGTVGRVAAYWGSFYDCLA